MPLGLFTAFLHLIRSGRSTEDGHAGVIRGDADGLSMHERLDIGMTDGRIPPGRARRSLRSEAWDLIEPPPRGL